MKHTPTFLHPLLFVVNPQLIYTTGNCFATKSGAQLPFCNRVGNTGPITTNDIENIKNYFGTIPFRWFIESTDTSSAQTLKEHGLSYKISFPAMHMLLKNIEQQDYPNARISEIHKQSDLELWAKIVTQSYGLPDAKEFTFYTMHQAQNAAPNTVRFYLAYQDNTPVAASMTIRKEHTVALHWVGTLPEYRNKGIGYAVSHKPLVDAKEDGCTDAVLYTSELGKPVYEKIGFGEYAVHDVYGF